MKTKKILSMVLALLMMITVLPLTALESNAYSNYETESNDTYSSADVLPLNNSICGNMNSESDIDMYKITIPQNGKLSLTFQHRYNSIGYGWTVRVYQYLNGEYIELYKTSVSLNSNIDGNDELPPIGAVAGGIYYIKVSMENSTNGSSWLVGNEYTIENDFFITEYYEKEINNSYNTANKMSMNKIYSGSLMNSNDVDVYKITSLRNGKLSLIFKHKYDSIGYGWTVRVYQYLNGEYIELYKTNISLNISNENYELPPIGAVDGGVYYIKVSMEDSKDGFPWLVGNEYGVLATQMLAQPTPKVANKNGCVSVTWSKSAGAKGYYVYRKAPGETSWKRIADVTGTSYNDKNVKSGTNYTYTVKAYNGSTYSSYHSGVTIKYLAQPTVKTANKNGCVSVTWSKTAGAKGYYVYRKAPGETSWKRIADVTGTSYNDKNVKNGTNYTYTVKAYNGSTYSSFHSGVAIKYLAQPAIKVANKSSYVSVTWSKTAGAKGYYVYRKGPNDKSWVRIANVTGTSYNDKNVKKGIKYTYTVKAYNGSYNSAYNAGITVKH